MAKTIPATFTDTGFDDFSRGGDLVQSDGDGGFDTIRKNHNWLVAYRTKHHVSMSLETGVAGGSQFGRSLRSVAGAWETRLEFRITPRRHMPRIYFRVNADTDGGTGMIRIVTPGPTASATMTFAAVFGAGNEQQGSVAVTDTQPPTTQVVQVQMQVGTSAYVDLRRLLIRDTDGNAGGAAAFVLTDLP